MGKTRIQFDQFEYPVDVDAYACQHDLDLLLAGLFRQRFERAEYICLDARGGSEIQGKFTPSGPEAFDQFPRGRKAIAIYS